MGWSLVAEDLLAGPRGRRLCWHAAEQARSSPGPGWPGKGTEQDWLVDVLERAVADGVLAKIATAQDEQPFLAPLVEAVDAAMYWQEPDDVDRALADPGVRRALEPVARAVASAPAARWWSSQVALDRQVYVQWLDGHLHGRPPLLTQAAAELQAWRVAAIEDEHRARHRPAEVTAKLSGYWWSTPQFSRLTSTSSSLPGMGAVGLCLEEDRLDGTDARCWPLRPQRDPQVFEISGPERWSELTARYPFEVTRSRRHDWWRVTGWAGPWLMPDWEAVAADYDAVHLTVGGYLTTAGRALPVSEARTVLAGWNPDETYWLTDVLTTSGPTTRWYGKQGEPTNWTAAADT